MGVSGLDVDKAVQQLDTAGSASQHRCAHFVRLAIQAGGVELAVHPVNAKDYGPVLARAGFEVVPPSGYNPAKGDVIVIQSYKGGSPAGHIEMFDGIRWVSDFKQPSHDIWPGPGYRASKPSYVIYRP